MLERREVLQALGALAAAGWDADGVDLNRADEWGERIAADVGQVDLQGGAAEIMTAHAHAGVERDAATGGFGEVAYADRHGVAVSAEIDTDGAPSASAAAYLTPEAARELAVALYQAAEELEAWRKATDD